MAMSNRNSGTRLAKRARRVSPLPRRACGRVHPTRGQRAYTRGRGRIHPARGQRKWQKGSALLAVLWMSAALAAIAFSLAATIRTETSRATTDADGLRARYLATGSVERGVQWMIWGP